MLDNNIMQDAPPVKLGGSAREQDRPGGGATCAVAQGPPRRDATPALMLCRHHLEFLNNFIFQFMKSEETMRHANEQRSYARC